MADASTSAAASATTAEESHPYTLETLKQHSTRDDLWLLINGKVYDVTKFMDEHPGGDEVLIEEAGRDGTEAFDDVGHSDEARAMLPKMLLGEFKGATSEKKAKRAGGATATSAASSSSSSLTYLIPVAVIGAYLAWRLLYA